MKQYCETCLVHGSFRAAAYRVTMQKVSSSLNFLEDVPLCEEHAEIIDSSVQQTNLPHKTPVFTIELKRIEA